MLLNVSGFRVPATGPACKNPVNRCLGVSCFGQYPSVGIPTELEWYPSDVDGATDTDLVDLAEPEIIDDVMTAPVVPVLADEFRCGGCFLIHHRSQLSRTRDGSPICRECE